MSEQKHPYRVTLHADAHGQLDSATLLARIDAALRKTEQRHPAITHAPLSPLHVTRKMGFKDVYFCDCGSVLDLNTKEARRQRKGWVAEHQECLPKEQDA